MQRVGADGQVTTRTVPAGTIALTFDDGPDPQWTPRVLDVLARYHAHATFFEIGSRVNQYPQLSRRVIADGDEIGSHTFTHAQPGSVSGWRLNLELTLTGNAIAAATGRVPVLMRPPYSSGPDAVNGADFAAMRRIGAAGYLVVLADRDTDDWQRRGVPAIVAAATPPGNAGAIVMMHDSGGDRSQTVAALRVLLPSLQARGYRFVTVSQALGLVAEAPAGLGQRLRGKALRWAQVAGAFTVRALTVLMLIAVVLGGLRLLIQVCGAWVHLRRMRRHRVPLKYLGPVSVIVPAYNEAANIAATVRSLVDSDYPGIEVIVVDDGSADGTGRIVRGLRLRGVHVVRQDNAGKPAALNTGLRYARAELVVMVDGDTVFEPDAVAWTEAPASVRQLWRQRYRWCYGTLQAMWKHQRALRQRGAAGRLGRRGLGYLLLFQVLLPLCAPMVDVYAVYGLLFLPVVQVAAVWCGFVLVQLLTAGYALRLDREGLRPLWTLPLQQVVYRQLMYLVVFQSTVMAAIGGRLHWHRSLRTGAARMPAVNR